jgi:hypothetical protein
VVTIILCGAACLAGLAAAISGTYAPATLLDRLGYELRAGLSADAFALLAAPLVTLGWRLAGIAGALALLVLALDRRWIRPAVCGLVIVGMSAADSLPVQRDPLVGLDWQKLEQSTLPASLGMNPGDRLFHYCTSGFGCPAGEGSFGAWAGSVRALEPVDERARRLWSALVPDVPLVYGFGAVAGNDGFTTGSRGDLLATISRLPADRSVRLLAALGIRWLVGMQPLQAQGIELRYEDAASGARFYEITAAAPRTYLAARGHSASSRAEALVLLTDPEFSPGEGVILQGQGRPFVNKGRGSIEQISVTGGSLHAVVESDHDTWWVVNDTFFPGWMARVDGQDTAIERGNGIARAVRVPVGRHIVEMHYRPWSIRIGAIASAMALVVTALLLLVPAREARRGDTS